MAAPKTDTPSDDTTDDSTTADSGKLYVLDSLFVARTDAKSTATRRYRRGDVFNPVDGVHDVDSLIAQKVIGRSGGDAQLVPTTALAASQAQAVYAQENSPVIDLESVPFEQSKIDPAEGTDDFLANSRVSQAGSTLAGQAGPGQSGNPVPLVSADSK